MVMGYLVRRAAADECLDTVILSCMTTRRKSCKGKKCTNSSIIMMEQQEETKNEGKGGRRMFNSGPRNPWEFVGSTFNGNLAVFCCS